MLPTGGFETLDRETCLSLLSTEPIGWLAHNQGERAHIVPVNFHVHSGEILIEAAYGRSLQAAANGQVMTLASGTMDYATQSGWSIVVVGKARLRGDDLVNPGVRSPHPWALAERVVPIAIPIERISGRRVGPPQRWAPPSWPPAPR